MLVIKHASWSNWEGLIIDFTVQVKDFHIAKCRKITQCTYHCYRKHILGFFFSWWDPVKTWQALVSHTETTGLLASQRWILRSSLSNTNGVRKWEDFQSAWITFHVSKYRLQAWTSCLNCCPFNLPYAQYFPCSLAMSFYFFNLYYVHGMLL